MNDAATRYEGRPFLRLLECYVLWAIDELPADHAATMERLTPKLQETYGSGGDWQQIVAAQMAFPPEARSSLRVLWDRNVEAMATDGASPDPEEFARQFVDHNCLR